ncbi:sel1 repeat family protein [Vibrio cincinnatiensis]|uniref:tetratricopeptide repeat protein n=1 Tax=Vibrio cincinnatiensis TaxID=675 RepID=UPI001EDF1B65|nr:hypothetical protein [Vibrio cincinnatiensis]MCG3748668.1 sel1 repeat family protein [Vibrio cincinnatiensis]
MFDLLFVMLRASNYVVKFAKPLQFYLLSVFGRWIMKILILLLSIFLLACEGNSQLSSQQLFHEGNELYEKGEIHEAVEKLVMSADMGDLYAKELLGFLYLREVPVKDRTQGYKLMSEAAEKGLASAQFYLGSCLYSSGCGIPENKSMSLYWLIKARDNGEIGAGILINILQDDEVKTLNEKEYAVIQREFLEAL